MDFFIISADDLNAWFAQRSPDCLDDPDYGYGDFRQCSASVFMRHAANWGLRQIGAPAGFDGYCFVILDLESFRTTSGAAMGLHEYGIVESETPVDETV